MNLKFALLGFLYYAPATGYELTKKFFKPLRPTRHVVYRYLNTMLEEGLAEADRVEQEKFPTKNVFHITEKGRDTLREWLTTYKYENFASDGIGPILWFSAIADKEDIVNLLNQYVVNAYQDYHYYQEQSRMHAKFRKDSYSELDNMYKSLVYDFTLTRWRENISFAEKAIRTISDFYGTGINKPSNDRSKKSSKIRSSNRERPNRLKAAGHSVARGKDKRVQQDDQVSQLRVETSLSATANRKNFPKAVEKGKAKNIAD
ncbi:MAG: PadR family transcriptional regulator [Chloroflexi bacterium]|nr:PadR family transcriptional regulator [Chloroflexota bacterium]